MAVHAGPLNNTKPSSLGAGIYNLIAALVAAGWTIESSGDGLAAYNATGSVFTSGTPSGSGANSWDNSGAWARIRYPASVAGGTRELLFVRGSSGTGYACIALSPNANFTSGSPSATQAPTASDQQFVLGSTVAPGSNAQWCNGTDGQTYMNAIADDAAPYNFWLGAFAQASGGDNGGFASDCLSGLSSGTGGTDPDGYIYFAGGAIWSNISFAGWHGFTNGVWTLMTANNTGSNVCGGSSVGNAYEGNAHDLFPIQIFGSTSNPSTDYMKGNTQHLLWDYHQTIVANHWAFDYNSVPKSKILMKFWAMPWDGSTPVTV